MKQTYPARSSMATRPLRFIFFIGLAVLLLAGLLARQSEAAEQARKPLAAKEAKAKDPHAWRSLFDGKTLKGWKATQFGGEGEVQIKEGCIVLNMGDPLTGINWAGDELPKINYEVRLEAKRGEGNDFFATTTFPVGDKFCSFVVGGWGGTVVGISSIDYYDASENETSNFIAFEDNQWYNLRIRVTKQRLECWVDDEKVVDFLVGDRKLSVRMEVEPSQPFGIASYITEGWLRNIRIRQLTADEVDEIPAK